jgi:hypothetical protein
MSPVKHSISASLRAWILIALVIFIGSQHLGCGTAYAANPVITSVSSPLMVGGVARVEGTGFSAGAKVNLFVTAGSGISNQGPLTPAAITSTSLVVAIPASVPLGEGVGALQVINTDQNYAASNVFTVQLAGSAAAGIPTLTAIDGIALASDSVNPNYALDNVETVVPPGSEVVLQGTGFDVVHGVAVDVFCACAGGKVGPFFINPGDPRLSSTMIDLPLPGSGPDALPVGPAAFVVSNRGADGMYSKKSNAVSVPIGNRIHVMSVTQVGSTLIVDGTGFSTLTTINFFTVRGGEVMNLGGMATSGAPAIGLTLISDSEFRFAVPAGAVPGPAYVQAINPPFILFTSSGNDPGGAFILTGPGAVATPTPIATPPPVATPTPWASPSVRATGLPTATPTPGEAYEMLMTGGIDNTANASGAHPALATAELYDEATGVFTSTAPMAYPRVAHSVTVLNNGTVLIAGGHNAFSVRAIPSAELYDIRTATFSLTGTMNSPRLNHAAVLLNNGTVLVAGGQNADFSAIDLAEIYDPATGLFTPTASMLNARMAPATAVLRDGTVLIAGGAGDSGPLANAELYDAAGAGSLPVGSMTTARQGAAATLLPNGTVLIAGGAAQSASCAGCATASAELFNPATKTFTATGSMSAPRRGHTATLLANGTVLITGGLDDASGAVLGSAEIYNPVTGKFSAAGNMKVARYQHQAALLASGKVLIAGGFDNSDSVTNSAEIFDPNTGQFTLAASMPDARAAYGMGCFAQNGTETWGQMARRAAGLTPPKNGPAKVTR